MSDRTWFVTGCSSGLGRALAEEVLDRGERLVATARDPATLVDLSRRGRDRALTLALDVTRSDQIEAAVTQAMEAFGGIDVLVNNAAFGVTGMVEDVSEADARRLFDTNFFGPLAVVRAALPHMRAAGTGHVVNIASIGGLRGRAGSGIYSASKFALVGLSEALVDELAPFGIAVTVVAPGGIHTEFFGRSLVRVPPSQAYGETTAGQRMRGVEQRGAAKSGNPRLMAKAIADAVSSGTPPTWLVLGKTALQAAENKLRALGDTLVAWRKTSLSVDRRERRNPAPRSAGNP